MSDKPVQAASAAVIPAIVSLAPYMLEATTLLVQFVQSLSAEDISEDDAVALQAAIDKYNQSAADRDAALDSLKALIEAKRAGG